MGVYIGEAGYNGRLLFTHTERYHMIALTNGTRDEKKLNLLAFVETGGVKLLK